MQFLEGPSIVSEGWIEEDLCDDHCAVLGCRMREDWQPSRKSDNSTRLARRLLYPKLRQQVNSKTKGRKTKMPFAYYEEVPLSLTDKASPCPFPAEIPRTQPQKRCSSLTKNRRHDSEIKSDVVTSHPSTRGGKMLVRKGRTVKALEIPKKVVPPYATLVMIFSILIGGPPCHTKSKKTQRG